MDLHVLFPDGLVARVDACLGPGQSRSDWIRRAVEQVLEEQAGRRGVPVSPPSTGVASPAIPAPAEQPEVDGVPFTPVVDRLRETRPAREFRPYPKGGG